MKKSYLFLAFIVFFPFAVISQSLSQERVKKIKDATVRITIEGSNSTGTGFIINSQGTILTCWHVISPCINIDANGKILGWKNIFVTFNNGEIVHYGIPLTFFTNSELNKTALVNDFCQLVPVQSKLNNYTFLKLGSFDDTKEGEEIYTCGYPVGLVIPFISKGIISTKYSDTSMYYINGNGLKIKAEPRNVAYLDITLNRGNSGGAIIRLGASYEDDEVIGIADFIINPFANAAKQVLDLANESGMDIGSGNGFSMNGSIKLLAEATTYASNGISGCVSIGHYLNALQYIK